MSASWGSVVRSGEARPRLTTWILRACSARDRSERIGTLVFLIDRPALCRADMDHESDQVKEGHSVDALALRGDEGRGTLR